MRVLNQDFLMFVLCLYYFIISYILLNYIILNLQSMNINLTKVFYLEKIQPLF
mgnify:CR=1 FL=1